MHQHEPDVSQVELGLRKRVDEKIVLHHLHAITRERLEQPRVKVPRDHKPLLTDSLREKTGRGAPTGTDVQATPSLAHADRLEQTVAERIVEMLQQLQAFSLELFRLESRKHVLGHDRDEVSDASLVTSSAMRSSEGSSCSAPPYPTARPLRPPP